MNDSPSVDPEQRAPLLPDNWRALSPLVDVVLDAPVERRAALLDELSGDDASKRAALQRLVAECEREAPLLDHHAAARFDALLAEIPDAPLPDVLGGRYRIERELGRGGMARVYLARDLKHARLVAVKVIRPELAASLGRDRFLREIRIAAHLHHPNIVALYDSGDADGVLYFVMPYEEGPSLRERLARDDMLPVAECVRVLRDIARALAYAHDRGVVHRDVKPDNVMLSGGAAVVADFGIAKAVSVAQGDTALHTLTQAGAGLGTAAYMSPEQAVGDPSTDHRTDINSFGCLAYELFSGKPPFHDLPIHLIIAAHVGTTPVPVTNVRADVPVAVAQLIARCLEKNPAARPQQVKELMVALDDLSTIAAPALPTRRRLSRAVVAALSLAGTLGIGVASYLVTRTPSPAAASAHELTVAVLPLLSQDGDSARVNLSYGLSDEIAMTLFRRRGVRVVSRLGVGNYRGQRDVDVRKIGQDYGAQYLVMGSLYEVGGRLRVLAKLVDVTDGAIVWADQFDRTQNDLAGVRDEIAKAVGDSLQSRAGVPVDSRLVAPKVSSCSNPDAYRLTVLAQGQLKRRAQSVRESVELYRQATQLDTLCADAYAGLSLALALTPMFHNTVSWKDVVAEATSAADHALRLNQTLALPHVAKGIVLDYAWDWDRAETEFKLAMPLSSSEDVEPQIQYSRHLTHVGRIAEARQLLLAARSVEPASAVVTSLLANSYFHAGQLDSAVVDIKRAFQNDPTNQTTLSFGLLIRFAAGDTAAVRDLVKRSPLSSVVAFYVLGAMGDSATAMKRLRDLESARPKPVMTETARAWIMLSVGDTAQALAALERATTAHEIWPQRQLVMYPVYDVIRGSDRFKALLRRMNLPIELASPVVRRRARQ